MAGWFTTYIERALDCRINRAALEDEGKAANLVVEYTVGISAKKLKAAPVGQGIWREFAERIEHIEVHELLLKEHMQALKQIKKIIARDYAAHLKMAKLNMPLDVKPDEDDED